MNFFISSSESTDWLIFLVMLVAMGIPIAAFAIWLTVFRHAGRKHHKHRKHRSHRPVNPTLAQTGGLPPMRDPNKPPAGT
jgi:hypothetical protein